MTEDDIEFERLSHLLKTTYQDHSLNIKQLHLEVAAPHSVSTIRGETKEEWIERRRMYSLTKATTKNKERINQFKFAPTYGGCSEKGCTYCHRPQRGWRYSASSRKQIRQTMHLKCVEYCSEYNS